MGLSTFIRSCNDLHFHNSDINTVFDLSSSIYNRDYEKINNLYKNQPISPELALVVGAITESQELIDHALENEKLVNYLILITELPLSLSWINFLCHRKRLLLILKNIGKKSDQKTF